MGFATLFPVGFPNVSRRDPESLPRAPVATFGSCVYVPIWTTLSYIFMAVVPMPTLIWAWALCQVPLRDGRSETVG